MIGSDTLRHVADQRAPAGGRADHLAGLDRAAIGLHGGDPAVRALEAGDLGVGMDLDAGAVGAARVPPDDGVVADDPAGRVIQRAHDRIRDVVGDVQLRAQPLDFGGVDQLRVDPVQAVDLGAVGHHEHRPVRMRQRQVAALREQQVEVELGGQPLVHLHALVVEASALRRLVVGAEDRRVATGRAGADVALLEHRDVLDAELPEVVSGREAVRAAADDHDVVAVAQLSGRGRHIRRERKISRIVALRQGVGADRAAAEMLGGVGDDLLEVLPERPADQHQQPVLVLDEQIAGGARDRARAKAGRRGDLRPHVDRAEARQQLAALRPDQRQRA